MSAKGDTDSVKIKMKKSIGLVSSVTLIIGSIIGSGIFVSPEGILINVRSFGLSLIIWISCGLFSLMGAYCYAELGTMIHRSGGDYAYVLDAYGPLIGFCRLWIEVLTIRPTAITIMGITFARYVLQPIFPTCAQPELAVKLLAAFCIISISFVNAISVRLATLVQDLFTYAKLIALAMIIVTGIVRICMGHTSQLQNMFDGSVWNPGNLANAFMTGLFAYSGWNYLNCVIEEMINPTRDLPIAIVFSCLVVTAIYALTNVAYVTVLSVQEVLTSPAVAVEFANRMFGPMAWVMPIFVACSTFGGVNGTIMTTSRIFFVASQENQMPGLLCFLHVNRLTPIPAVFFTCVVSLAYLMVDDIYSLMTYMGFAQWLAIGLSVLSVIFFRFTRKNARRPIKAPLLFAVIYVTLTACLIIFSFIGSPTESLMGAIIILAGVPVYFIGCVWKRKPKAFTRAMCNLTVGSQKLLQLVPGN